MMRAAGDGAHGRRLRGLIVILWRAGRRIQEALALTDADLDQRRGSLLVRRGKGGWRREVGMDDGGWQERQPWLELRLELPIGPLFCVINGTTGVSLIVTQRQLGHSNLRITSVYLQGIDNERCSSRNAALARDLRAFPSASDVRGRHLSTDCPTA